MSSDLKSLSNFCLLYSLVGTIFMGWVGLMLTHQPFFIGGIEDTSVARSSAFGACVTFIITFMISAFGLFASMSEDGMSGPRRREGGSEYEGIPQGTMPSVLEDYASNLELPPSVQDGVFS